MSTTPVPVPVKPIAVVAASTHYLTHVFYIVVLLILSVCGDALVKEHDARVIAEQTIKTDEATVKTLEQQIASIQSTAKQRVVVIQKVAAAIKTTPQAIPPIKDFDVALNPRPLPAFPLDVQVAAVPLAQDLEQAKIDKINLVACQGVSAAQVTIIAQKSDEIVALKRKPRFWKQVGSTMKKVGIGVAIGAAIVIIH